MNTHTHSILIVIEETIEKVGYSRWYQEDPENLLKMTFLLEPLTELDVKLVGEILSELASREHTDPFIEATLKRLLPQHGGPARYEPLESLDILKDYV